MKKQLTRVVSAKLYSKFFKATALVLMFSGSSYLVDAQVTQVSARVEHRGDAIPDAQISNLGVSNGMLTFEVKVNNVTGERFRVTVKDTDGTVLFQESYDDKNFVKKFVVPKTDSNQLILTIRNSSNSKSQSFEINSSSRIVEDVVVKRI